MSDTPDTPPDGFEFVVTGSGVELAVKRSGEGPAVLLIGGLGMPSVTWDISGLPGSLVDAGFEVITYNARGVSPSSAPDAPYSVADLADDAAALLDHFEVGPTIVIGYSMGCYTAQSLLRSRRELVQALVLFAGLQPSPISAMVGEMELGLIDRYGEVPREVLVFEQLLTTLHHPLLQDPATVTGWQQVLSAGYDSLWTAPEGFRGQLTASQQWITSGEPTPEHLAAIDVPTLVLAFEHDLFFPPDLCAATARQIAGAEFAQIDGVGHGGIFTGPGDSAARITEFCRARRGL
ncbi:putative hydrolase or acyltransferase of alpha/beta superfamily [Mycolicibacterium chubuense NBB4]|uniref:Putative hydrolase or acyltransferase of alpha/beta superfamily n=1 Tax=Mycolicibacterium chubuense (strain NBB4) TaxID=710421 RepID=I4BD36_MYCCN|nr:alpha/beta hydrolase [Mycolicibacterium chubuense]AFM15193.1 putative hydrolase or acyltransferase of alpha/beta superfamily [Mycolicibacterium chubuense NBB4]